jgi:hypothetical protein
VNPDFVICILQLLEELNNEGLRADVNGGMLI